MLDISFMEIAKEYGLGTAILMIIVPWAYRIDKRSRDNKKDIQANKEALEIVHDSCHIPEGAVEEMRGDIRDLQNEDHDINSRLSVLESTMNRIDDNVSQVLMHLTKKGIDRS